MLQQKYELRRGQKSTFLLLLRAVEWARSAWGGVSYITISLSDQDGSVIYREARIVLAICGGVWFYVDAPRRLYRQMDASYFRVWQSNRYIYHCPHSCRGTLTPSELLKNTFVPFSIFFFSTRLKGTWQTTLAHLPESNLNQRLGESG